MSLSSINRLSFKIFRATQSIGIAIGRREIAAVCLAKNGKTSVMWSRAEPSPPGLFSNEPAPGMTRALTDSLIRLVGEQRRHYVPVHVALPDPISTMTVFEMDSIPASKKLREQLVRWRFANETGLQGEVLNVASQDLGNDGAKRLLLAQAMPGTWLSVFKDAMRDAGVTAWSLNQAAVFRFNKHHERLKAVGGSGALLMLEVDSWTVAIWDGAFRLRYIRSRWRDETDAQRDESAIAEEFERLVLAYVHAGNRTVDRIYVCGRAPDREHVTSLLDRKLDKPCELLVAEIAGVGDQANAIADSLAVTVASCNED